MFDLFLLRPRSPSAAVAQLLSLAVFDMRTLYCKSEASFLDLLSPMFAELDSLYWVVACQTGPVRSDWIYESEEHERILTELHVPVPAFDSTSLHLWRPGSLSRVRDVLYFDEWSYFIGFHAAEQEAVSRAARLGLSDYFSPEFYDLLTQEGQVFVMQVDGWWEFCPATDAVFDRIMACAPCREITPRSPRAVDWTPQFV
jgi:hypothetical protein